MARKKSGAGLWLIVGILALIAMVPQEVWIGLGVIGVVAIAAYLVIKWQASTRKDSGATSAGQPTLSDLIANQPRAGGPRHGRPGTNSGPSLPPQIPPPETPTPPPSRQADARSAPPPLPAANPRPASQSLSAHWVPPGASQPIGATPTRTPSVPPRSEPEFYSAPLGAPASSEKIFSIPQAPPGSAEGRWVPAGQVVRVAGLDLPGGMLYVGTRLKAANGSTEPSLISEHLNIARQGDYRERHTNYWPSFSDISAPGRRAYLNWLAEGRSHPDCDIGLVFLFFYGLERRVIFDTAKDPAIKTEWPTIARELRRLLAIYGQRSGSFLRYAGELLNWIELDGASSNAKLYLEPIPSFPRGYELPAYLKLALGQASLDRAPLPGELALAWVRLNPQSGLRTAATRCPDEFEQLFLQRYREVLGRGLVLPKNRTKLKFVYQPASAGFNGATISLGFGDVPDVTALTAPIRTLMEIANQCTDELGPFSRLVGKDASARASLDGLLQLPATLWPAEAQKRIEALRGSMQAGSLTQRLDAVIALLGGSNQALNRDRVRTLARALQDVGIGMEPDVLAGARAPGAADPVVLFALSPGEASASDTDAYRTAALTLQLASAVAHADGSISEQETLHLRKEIELWSHLTPRSRERLHAHLSWLVSSPMTLAGLKKKLDPLEQSAKQVVATFMATLAQADGMVSPDEVKFLEKVYKALGVEPKQVFSDIHAVGAGNAPSPPTATTGFRLDAARIAELEKDTARVSALLSEIFTEETVPPPAAPPVEVEPTQDSGLLGLDEAHSALVRLMLSRPQWSRTELEDAASDLELMLDGALEHVNEACFDAHDIPLSEGEDPIDIHPEALEKIEA
jgi:tellurite resistance protein